MSSELLGSAQNVLKGNLGGAWDINKGYADAYTDLGIARRFGGSAAAYSLRDIGAMNGRVVKVRRDVDGQGTDPEEDFSASQVASGALEDWVNGKFENTLPADVDTAAAAYSLRKVKDGYSGNAVRIRRSSDDAEVNVAFDSDDKVSTSSSISVVSGSVSGTTLGDFISGTNAFVHTWYDQVGSNDITQTTAANQPKIAESGALLADGVDFDGSASYLDATSALGATTTIGAFIVHKPDDTDENQYLIDNRDATSDGMRIMQRSDADGNYRFSMDSTNVNSASGSVTTNETLLTAIQSSTAATLFKNAAQQATAADDAISVTAAFRIGANRVSTGTYFDGTMKEIILFTSDQSDNRFKIESNINNYYGLYNDDNEQRSAQFSTSGGTADTSEELRDKFGFTGSGGAGGATGFFGIRLKEKLPNTKTIQISFNSTKASSSSSFGVALYRGSNQSDTIAQSAVTPIAKGFNSITLTSNNDDAEYITFSEDDEVVFTVSDFRVSLVSRNGFVETLYDQSSNGNDVDQTTAAKQPAIVKNGGIVKVGDEASIRFDGTNDFLERATYSQGTLSQPNTAFAVAKLRVFVDANQKIFDGHDGSGRNMLNISTLGNGQFAAFAGTVVATGEDGDANQNLFTVRYSGSDSRLVINGVTKTTSTMGTDGMIGLTIGANHDHAQNFWDGDIQEVIIFNSDIFDDRSNIQDDVNNYYTIYS
jgi:hypothetical protein